MDVLLDTSFIVSCVKRRIDFFDELSTLGFRVVVPKEVLQELKDLKMKKGVARPTREAIDVAFEMIESNKDVKTKSIGGRYVDEGLIEKGKAGAYVATLDSEIKHAVPNIIVIDSAKNGLKVVRS